MILENELVYFQAADGGLRMSSRAEETRNRVRCPCLTDPHVRVSVAAFSLLSGRVAAALRLVFNTMFLIRAGFIL